MGTVKGSSSGVSNSLQYTMGDSGTVPYPWRPFLFFLRMIRSREGDAEVGIVSREGFRISEEEFVLESVVTKGDALSLLRTVWGNTGCNFRISFCSRGNYDQICPGQGEGDTQ